MRSSFPRLAARGWDSFESPTRPRTAASPLPTSFTKTAVISFRLYFCPRLRWVDRWRRQADPRRGQYNRFDDFGDRSEIALVAARWVPPKRFRDLGFPAPQLKLPNWSEDGGRWTGRSLKPHTREPLGTPGRESALHSRPARQALSKLW